MHYLFQPVPFGMDFFVAVQEAFRGETLGESIL